MQFLFISKRQEVFPMPRFSLIVPTLGRTTELTALFASIADQDRNDVELIVVDQNNDERIAPLVAALPSRIAVVHLRQQEENVSAARNAGLVASSGDIIAFPDDDCWYPSHLLDGVDSWFREHQQYSVLAVGALDDGGIPSGNRWIQDACDINPLNVLRTTFCSSLFVTAVARDRAVLFDPKLNRGEETDFILRLLATGLRGRFDRSFYIHHPRRDMLSGTVSRARAISYGAGMGRLVRRHSLVMLWVGLLTYDLARALMVSVKGQFVNAGFCFAHAEGLLLGFILPESNYE
jgi:glycosyltransferase involved in cell wall biosynthesis